jgi:uncharacterized damage-inducible protein DinB
MSIGRSMIPEFDMEMAGTRKVLERIPDDRLDWKIHAKSNTIGWVANHLADIPAWVDMTISHDCFDIEPVAGQPHKSPNEKTTDAIVALFDKNVAQARTLLEGVEDATLFQPWQLLKQGKAILTMPRLAVIRTWVFNHTIHHRAHLCVYLRVNDIPVPGLYGPSADESPM